MIMKASIYSVSFTLARGRNRSCAADNSEITTFYGVPISLGTRTGHFKPTGSRLGQLKSTFNVRNFIRRLYWSVCSDFCTIRSRNVCRSPKSPKSQQKQPYLGVQGHPRSSRVIDFGANRKPVYDFLLVINTNLGPHRF